MKITATLDTILRDLPNILAAGVEVAEVEVEEVAPTVTHYHWQPLLQRSWYSSRIPWNCDNHPKATIPCQVFDFMNVDMGACIASYPTEAEARKALSDAVIAWAKQEQQQ